MPAIDTVQAMAANWCWTVMGGLLAFGAYQAMSMTYKEAAKFLGVTTRTLSSWVRQRRLSYIKYGYRTVRFREVDLVEFQQKNTIKAKPI